MKIETQPLDDHQVTMIVELETEKLEGAKRRAARKISEKVKIPGFRPGKTPYDVVRRMYGDAVLVEEALEILVDDIYGPALAEANIEPGATGEFEKLESLDPLKLVFKVPLKPTVDLGDYKSVRLEYKFIPPTETNLDEEILNLRRMYSNTESVERPVEDGDYVLLDLVGREANSAEDAVALIERNGFAQVARKDAPENEWPYPGFSANMIGMGPGESKTFAYQFPADFKEENYAGKTVNFELTVKTVRSVSMPELDDDFAKKTGLGQTVDQLRQRMQENIELEARNLYEDEYFENLLELIKAGATIKYPPQVLDHEVEHVLEDLERRLASQGIENLEAYFGMTKTTKEQFTEEHARPTAIKRLERGLVMDEIARVENIKVDNQMLEAEFSNTWADLAMNDQEFARQTKNGTKPSREIIDAVAMNTANRIMTRNVLSRMKAIATGEETNSPVTSEEAPTEDASSTVAE